MVTAPTAVKGSNTIYDAANNVGVDAQVANAVLGVGGTGVTNQHAKDLNIGNTPGSRVYGTGTTVKAALDGIDAELVTIVATPGGPTVVSLAADFAYTKDGDRHASLLAVASFAASTVYAVKGMFAWTGLADGGEQATFDLTLPTSATFVGNVHWVAATTPSDAYFSGSALGKVSSGAKTFAFVDGLLTIDSTHLTGFVFDFGDNSGAGTAVIAKGSYFTYFKVA